jgi:hypothetical protein
MQRSRRVTNEKRYVVDGVPEFTVALIFPRLLGRSGKREYSEKLEKKVFER